MRTINKFNYLNAKPDLGLITDASINNAMSELNCMKIGIIQSFNPEEMTVRVQIANKKQIGTQDNGDGIYKDYPLVYAKVCFCNPFITYDIQAGEECLLFFADDELESWFINGDINTTNHTRIHNITDAVAVCGIRSLPKMITMLQNCINLFYGTSNIEINENTININATNVNINGTLTINGTPYLSHVHRNGNQGANTGGVVE